MNEEALFLLAGRGSRLGILGDNLPKCLVSVAGEPMLHRMLDMLSERGCKRAIMVIGHLGEMIRKSIGNKWKNVTVDYIHNEDWSTTNNIVSMNMASDAISSDILLIEGDIILSRKALSLFNGNGNQIAVSRFLPHMNGTAVTIEDGTVKRFLLKKEHRTGSDTELFKTVNIYRITLEDLRDKVFPELEALINSGETGIYYEQAFANLSDKGLMVFEALDYSDTEWAEVDNEEDLMAAEKIFSQEMN